MNPLNDKISKKRKRRSITELQKLYDTILASSSSVPLRWQMVLPHLARYESFDFSLISTRDGKSILHVILESMNPPLEAILLILRPGISSGSLLLRQTCNEEMLTPLAVAVRNLTVSEKVYHILITKDRRSWRIYDDRGFAPVHSCIVNANTTALRLMLTADPTLATFPTHGTTSSSALRLAENALQFSGKDRWLVFCLLVRCAHYGSINHRSMHNLHELHASFALDCEPETLDMAMKTVGQAGVRDCKGFYPLHYAVKSRHATGAHISSLVANFPPATAVKLPSGDLPLVAALKNRKKNLGPLVDAYPVAASITDTSTGLLPLFQASKYSDLDSIFRIMRAFPQTITTHTRAER